MDDSQKNLLTKKEQGKSSKTVSRFYLSGKISRIAELCHRGADQAPGTPGQLSAGSPRGEE